MPEAAMIESTPSILRALIAGLSAEQIARKPAAERFSIADVLAHLADAERRTYTPRIRALAAGGNLPLPAYVAPDEPTGTPGANLNQLETLRSESVSFLAALPEDAFHNTGVHSRLGPMTLENILAEIAYHDLGHIKQVCELVRWLEHYPRMGPFQAEYSVQP